MLIFHLPPSLHRLVYTQQAKRENTERRYTLVLLKDLCHSCPRNMRARTVITGTAIMRYNYIRFISTKKKLYSVPTFIVPDITYPVPRLPLNPMPWLGRW